MKTAVSDTSHLSRTIDARGSQAGLAAIGSGAVLLLLGRIANSSVLRTIGTLTTLAGAALYARERMAERNRRIEQAADHIRAELDDLDPVAKAQVIADLAHPTSGEQPA